MLQAQRPIRNLPFGSISAHLTTLRSFAPRLNVLSSAAMPQHEMRSSKEDKLIELGKAWDKAIDRKNLEKLDQLLSNKVVFHADKVTQMDNVNGRVNVLNFMKSFFERYSYERAYSVGAVDEGDNVAFSLSVDKGVTPKKGVHEDQKGDQVKPSNVINLTMLEFDEKMEIRNIYLLRQLSYDEAHRKLKKVPDYHGSSFNPEHQKNEDIEASPDRARSQEHAAYLWNQMFTENDVSKAEEICDPNVKVHNLLVSQETKGLAEWKKSLSHIFQGWECKGNRHCIAVTPGNKAFIWWETTGTYNDSHCTVWGITYLTFNADLKVTEAASMYQPFPGMRESLLKAA